MTYTALTDAAKRKLKSPLDTLMDRYGESGKHFKPHVT